MDYYTATTTLGCRIQIVPSAFGTGVILRLSIDDPDDTRTAEVYLTTKEADSLAWALPRVTPTDR